MCIRDRDKVNTLVPPSEFTLDNYVELFVNRPIFTWFINTLVVAGVTLLSQLTTALLAGYALAKLRFPGRGIAFNCVLVTLMIPFQVLLTPLYIMAVSYTHQMCIRARRKLMRKPSPCCQRTVM